MSLEQHHHNPVQCRASCCLAVLLFLQFSFQSVFSFYIAENAYHLPLWRQILWSLLFVLMATVSTCGNLIVIWIVMSHKRMRTVTNYFIGKRNPANQNVDKIGLLKTQ